MREDTQNRLLPGDGDLDLPRAVRALDRIGALRWVGPEVISPVTEAMPPVEAARVAVDRVRELIARVRSDAAAEPRGAAVSTDRDVDVLVVGSGAAGLAAALAARENGAGSVLVAEAEGVVGGSSRLSGGLTMGAGTRYQRA